MTHKGIAGIGTPTDHWLECCVFRAVVDLTGPQHRNQEPLPRVLRRAPLPPQPGCRYLLRHILRVGEQTLPYTAHFTTPHYTSLH